MDVCVAAERHSKPRTLLSSWVGAQIKQFISLDGAVDLP